MAIFVQQIFGLNQDSGLEVFWPWFAFITGLVLRQTNIALEDFVSLQDISCIYVGQHFDWHCLPLSGHHQPSVAITRVDGEEGDGNNLVR